MFMRFVQTTFKPDTLPAIHQLYDEKIIPQLKKTPGCLYACLIRSDSQPDEGISLTLWESQQQAEMYEKSGVFSELLDEVKPFLADASEWKIQLSEDLTLEYQPVQEEPVVQTLPGIAQFEDIPDRLDEDMMVLRILTVKIQPDKDEEFKRIYKQDILPALRKVPGCRYAYLTPSVDEENKFMSITLWESKKDADNYEESGRFAGLTHKVKHTFTELYQWKMLLDREGREHAVTSDDMELKTYHVVTGGRIQ